MRSLIAIAFLCISVFMAGCSELDRAYHTASGGNPPAEQKSLTTDSVVMKWKYHEVNGNNKPYSNIMGILVEEQTGQVKILHAPNKQGESYFISEPE